jgi:hypothetical protein
MTTRGRRLLTLGALVAALLPMLAPSAARAGIVDTSPLPSALTAESFTSGKRQVRVDAERAWLSPAFVCIEASAVTAAGPESRTVDYEVTCGGLGKRSSSYRFAPIRWVASIGARLNTVRVIQHQRLGSDGDWVTVSETARPSTAIVRLRWVGHGETKPEHVVSGTPGSCYALPPICTSVIVRQMRQAVVSGTIAFHGIGVQVSVPAGHPGVMTAGRR